MSLPSTIVNNLTFSGRSPGQLVQEIRTILFILKQKTTWQKQNIKPNG